MTYESPYNEEVEIVPLLRREKQTGWRWSPRYTVAVLGCVGILVEYCQRVNLSIAIVAMTGSEGSNGSHALDVCPASHNSSSGAPTKEGVTFPSINAMLATWVLPSERSKFSTIVYSGFQIGTVVGLVASGWLCSSTFLGGWPSAFYVFGVCGLVWGLAWCCFIYERPEDHPGLSDADLRMLRLHQESVKGKEVIPVPWLSIATSLPFWAIMATSLGNDYGFYTLLTELPTYLHDIQHFDLDKNGMLSALPYLLMWVFSLAWAALVDVLTARDKVTIVTVRRLSMAVSLYGPMFGLVAMCFVNCNAVLAVAVLCLSGMLSGAVNSGYLCSHQDLAPNFAGTLLGITNTLGALAGIAGPAVTGHLEGRESIWAWREVFLISAGLYLVTCTFYLVFISADVQPWNDLRRARGQSNADDKTSPYEPI
ncbi:LOW QUALITY PROTEIN: putative inorganic phosphate cotransporter [Penaeus monodon]|uniref:LOW QUALITY PROTEIN: putative inorganic phosphate cotransporter n=1 Tax=Penaeus monodon TaxID=6687 RepID=UPI0018A79153|nr:LOW QUALITY PROTEIN: putative inorganic phosphate cotransporter [Penaeus monodon]